MDYKKKTDETRQINLKFNKKISNSPKLIMLFAINSYFIQTK